MTATRRFTVFAVVSLIAAACGGSPATNEGSTATETPVVTQAPASAVTTSAVTTTAPAPTSPPPPLVITASDYWYDGVPEVVPTGTTVSLTNESLTEFHEAAIIRLDADDNRTVEELKALSASELIDRTGTLQTVLLARPGQLQYARGPGNPKIIKPGRYFIFCAVPIGADPAVVERQVEFGPPAQIEGRPAHYQVTMFAEFVVED